MLARAGGGQQLGIKGLVCVVSFYRQAYTT